MDELSEQILQTACRFVEICNDRAEGKLDYSEASLAAVEEMLAEAADFADEMTDARIGTLVREFGCYIMEVGRREFGGCYRWYEERAQPVLVVGEPLFRVSMLSWDKVRSRIAGDDSDNIPFHYAGFARRVRQAIPGTDALYV
ncbi:hypothetical protein [Chamaesiphon polymorphus]|uniref:Uncharacterized protein n=1 Tax=Chamaesiphon polymorphus CCALA 037 TaxID=2107692 RepID=A0A2T1GB60_9CYAN|nr:hypothetical protein [Chamaesiphon polymorphus]PSB54531.1 hypothetical protein C7B77_17875 [Chamaesiphon polymorphus CCALA 037]